MKKLIILLTVLGLAFALSACQGEAVPDTSTTSPTQVTTQPATTAAPTQPATTAAPTQPVHVCTPGVWDMDLQSHWSNCIECGQQIPVQAHSLDSDNFCTVCGAEVWIYAEDLSSIYLADAYGNTVLCKYYDTTGELLYANTWEYTYTDQGVILTCLEYSDGVLTSESSYDPDTGNIRTVNEYYEDGSWQYTEYDEYASIARWISYDADGTALFDYSYSYTYAEDGTVMGEKVYENGALITETVYAIYNESDGFYTYPAKETVYFSDGSYTVTEYNENYQVLSEQYYDAAGSLVDSSAKFDPAACGPLFGTWQGGYTIDGSMVGSNLDIRCDVTMTFDDQGMLYSYMAINMEDMKLATIDALYTMYLSYGYSREEIDQLFQSEMGMTVEEYVILSLESMDVMETTQSLWEVYYVEDGLLYTGTSWTSYMESTAFSLDGDTLTLSGSSEDGMETTLVLTKTAE